jgi:hypothetical protein
VRPWRIWLLRRRRYLPRGMRSDAMRKRPHVVPSWNSKRELLKLKRVRPITSHWGWGQIVLEGHGAKSSIMESEQRAWLNKKQAIIRQCDAWLYILIFFLQLMIWIKRLKNKF